MYFNFDDYDLPYLCLGLHGLVVLRGNNFGLRVYDFHLCAEIDPGIGDESYVSGDDGPWISTDADGHGDPDPDPDLYPVDPTTRYSSSPSPPRPRPPQNSSSYSQPPH